MTLRKQNYMAGCVIQFLPASLLNDRELMKSMIRVGADFRHLPDSVYSDRKFVEEVLDSNRDAAMFFPVNKLPADFLDDKQLAIKAVTSNVWSYRSFSEKVRDDINVQCAVWTAAQKMQMDDAQKSTLLGNVFGNVPGNMGIPVEVRLKALDGACKK